MNNFVLYKKRKNLNIYELYYKIKNIYYEINLLILLFNTNCIK